jgi:hypothetical protein
MVELIGRSDSGKRTDMMNISVPEIIRGFCKGIKAYRFNRLHGDWVLMVRYSPELSSVISCCHSTDTALLMKPLVNANDLISMMIYGNMTYWFSVYL